MREEVEQRLVKGLICGTEGPGEISYQKFVVVTSLT